MQAGVMWGFSGRWGLNGPELELVGEAIVIGQPLLWLLL